jgi:uncharacterized damage-inducible protein DinB
MSKATQASVYATQFEAVSDEVITTVTDCSDEQLRRTTAREGWPVVVVAHHLAVVYGFFNGVLAALADEAMTPVTVSAEAVDENNARHAREYATVGKAETLDALRASRGSFAETLRALDDEQLLRTIVVYPDGTERSAAQVVQIAVIGQTRDHLASIRDTIAS